MGAGHSVRDRVQKEGDEKVRSGNRELFDGGSCWFSKRRGEMTAKPKLQTGLDLLPSLASERGRGFGSSRRVLGSSPNPTRISPFPMGVGK